MHNLDNLKKGDVLERQELGEIKFKRFLVRGRDGKDVFATAYKQLADVMSSTATVPEVEWFTIQELKEGGYTIKPPAKPTGRLKVLPEHDTEYFFVNNDGRVKNSWFFGTTFDLEQFIEEIAQQILQKCQRMWREWLEGEEKTMKYAVQFVIDRNIIVDTDPIEYQEAIDLYNNSLPDFIQSYKTGIDAQLVIWEDVGEGDFPIYSKELIDLDTGADFVLSYIKL